MIKSAVHILLQGQVQGVGLRPAVLRWANDCSIAGWITNQAHGVEIHAEGEEHDVNRFVQSLQYHLPPEATLVNLTQKPSTPEGHQQFLIRQNSSRAPVGTVIPSDVVTCQLCMSETMRGRLSRRQGYAFNSCAQCGPRYSILDKMPFERNQTSMASFPLCMTCESEFHDNGNRRLHAQTMSCPHCGPSLELMHHEGRLLAQSQFALTGCAAAIKEGKIIAVKGLGGYQLICDASNEVAVRTLRDRKGRSRKPLAVMVIDLDMAASLADLTGIESTLLSRSGPIVLCPAKADNGLTHLIHPGLNLVGLMLPTTSFHHLLCEAVDKPLVVTSGNPEGEPLVYSRAEAQTRLVPLCDQMLHHNRTIHRPIDDSVVRSIAGRVATIRLARGLAPLQLPVKIREPLVALGGQQKVALAMANGRQAILGPHLGEMETVAAHQRFYEHYQSLSLLYGTQPRCLVHDGHPDYFTTRWAEKQPQPKIAVQHHHAHVVAGMVEHGWLHETVLGFAFDGTGYGIDGTIWGGETLLCTAKDFHRLAHLRQFRLLGGEQAVRQPLRVTLALLADCFSQEEMRTLFHQLNRADQFDPLIPLLQLKHRHPLTSSVGRLIDGVAALILSISNATYEGEPAMMLESICDTNASGSYPLPLIDHHLDWRPMLQPLIRDLLGSMHPGAIAMRFHRGLAESVASMIRLYPHFPAILAGGCFQNKILIELIHELLDDVSRVGFPGVIPCNDGGLAAGQLTVAAARLNCLDSEGAI